MAWSAARKARSVGEAFAELRSMAAGGGYRLELPKRINRRDGFSGSIK